MTDADNVMNPQHFGSDPAGIQIRIRINPEIWIRIPDHGLRFWPGVGLCCLDTVQLLLMMLFLFLLEETRCEFGKLGTTGYFVIGTS